MLEAGLELSALESLIAKLSATDRKQLEQLAAEELKKPFIPNPGPQTEALLTPADILLFGGQAGGGKGLSLDTLIATPSGFTTMGDIRCGDIVFDQDGEPCRVLAVSPVHNRQCFRITFDDGSEFTADDVHRWLTMTAKERERALCLTDEWRARRRAARPSRAVAESKKPWVSEAVTLLNKEREHSYVAPPVPSIRETQEIAQSVTVRGGSRLNHSVEVAGAFRTSEQVLPIDPYLFGLWLGDGISASGAIGMLSEDWANILPHVPCGIVSRRVEVAAPRRRPFETIRFEGLQVALRALGTLGNKHIPSLYQRASIEQRRELLRGLLDTDGSCDERGRIEIGLSNRRLAEDVQELVCGLGAKAALNTKQIEGANDSHRIIVHLDFPAFKLERKLKRQRSPQRSTTRNRYIAKVVEVPSVPTKCIAVDSPSRTYLIGRTFVPTHNSAVEIGCAALNHYDGIIFRREATQLDGLIKFGYEVFSGVDGAEFNKVDKVWKWGDGRTLKFAGLQQEDDWRKHAGNAHDYLAFDEAGEFLRVQVFSLIGWLRTTRPGQRCRVILGSNPPRGGDGQWMLEEFAPWLDPLYPKPAKPGELRWAIVVNDVTEWVEGPGSYERNGEPYEAMSRTFIPASLNDNPYLKDTGYRAKLQQLPEPLRSQLLHGDFLAGREDDEWQVIPTSFVREAQSRWLGEPRTPMVAIATDPAQGGSDKTAIARLHDDNSFATIESWPGADTPDGPSVAALILKLRRNNASVAIDMTGGWGGSARDHLRTHNQIEATPIVFSAEGPGSDKDTGYGYANLRAKMYWEFRKALDPNSGEEIVLPPSDKLLAQLTAALWRPRNGKIQIESKEAIRERLGVSPDEADAVVMAWYIRHRAAKEATKVKPRMRPRTAGSQGWMGR